MPYLTYLALGSSITLDSQTHDQQLKNADDQVIMLIGPDDSRQDILEAAKEALNRAHRHGYELGRADYRRELQTHIDEEC